MKVLKQIAGLIIWVGAGFFAAQFLVALVFLLLDWAGISLDIVNDALLQTVLSGMVYVTALVIVIGLPWWIRSKKVTRQELGLQRLPTWFELIISPAGFIAYLFASGILVALVSQFVPGFDVDQAQDVGFQGLTQQYELALAFVSLVIIAPVAEEILLRGYLYGKLKQYTARWVAIILVSALFGALHGQWNVAIDTFMLSVAACLLRDWTGSLWPAMLIHIMKNGLAYYFLFINPITL